MNASGSLDEVLSAVARIFLWSFVAGIVLLLLSFGLILGVRDFAYTVHSRFFSLSKHEFDVIWYSGMGVFKLSVFVLFLIPWIGVRLTQRGMRKRAAAPKP
jgi:hypothetical protein